MQRGVSPEGCHSARTGIVELLTSNSLPKLLDTVVGSYCLLYTFIVLCIHKDISSLQEVLEFSPVPILEHGLERSYSKRPACPSLSLPMLDL